LKTPTKVAELLIERVVRCDQRLELATRDLRRASLDRLRRGREALGSAERGVALARTRLQAAGARVAELSRALGRTGRLRLRSTGGEVASLARRLAATAPRAIGHRREDLDRAGRRIVAAARGHLREAEARIGGIARLAHELAPERTLERGFSITRNAAGRALRHPGDAPPGEIVTTRLARGRLTSTVVTSEEIEASTPAAEEA
jgi:exodeoxyribonuclease VII large subunit